MQELNIAEAGFGYIFKCIGAYYEGNIYFLLYIISLVFLAFAVCGKRWVSGAAGGAEDEDRHAGNRDMSRMGEIFLPQFIMMALTVYNPLFPVALNSFFDVNKEYYRFLWMSPVIICIAATGVLLIFDFTGGEEQEEASEAVGKQDDNAFGEKNRKKQKENGLHKSKSGVRTLPAVVFFICLLIAGGTYLYRDGYIVSPNVYHMPTEIPEVAEIIHKDADQRLYFDSDTDREEGVSPTCGNEYPRAMFEYDFQMQMRQYDAGILLSCDREQYLRALAGEVTYDTALEDGNYTDRLLAAVALGIRIPEDDLVSALENTGTEYIVVSTMGGMIPYYREAGLTVVGETANHTVLHYEAETPVRFTLPDYSEVWRLTPQWWDFLM